VERGFAPAFASWSATSLPKIPTWERIQLIFTGADDSKVVAKRSKELCGVFNCWRLERFAKVLMIWATPLLSVKIVVGLESGTIRRAAIIAIISAA
jgi:hypothetical protein